MNTHFTEQGIRNLPQLIVARLKAVIRRVRRIQLLKGVFAVLAVALIAALVVMGIDAAFAVESKSIRLTLSLAALAVTALALWVWLLRPLSRRISLTTVARWLEEHHPEMQERISTAVELIGQPGQHGSENLLAEVVKGALDDVATLNPKAELSNRLARGPLITACAAAAILAAILIMWPRVTPRLLARLFNPLQQIGNAYADQIRLLAQSRVIAENEPLDIEVAVKGSPERVVLRMTYPDGKESIESLVKDDTVRTEKGETGYALRLPAIPKTFTALAAAGKAVTEPFTITVLPRPIPESLTLTFDYPA